MSALGISLQQSYVLLSAKGMDFAVAAADILEVFRSAGPLVKVPTLERDVQEIVRHKNRSLPVTDIASWCRNRVDQSYPASEQPLICVLQLGTRWLGMEVDHLSRVERLSDSAVQRTFPASGSREIFDKTLSIDGALWPILDVGALMNASQTWSDAYAPSRDPGSGGQRTRERVALFRVGQDWFALPVGYALEASSKGRVQPLGSGHGLLVGAVSWRSQILPVICLRPGARRQALETDLMLVVRGKEQIGDARSHSTVAIEIDAVDQMHWISRPLPTAASTEESDQELETCCIQIADGRRVTLLDPTTLIREYAFDWSNGRARAASGVPDIDDGVDWQRVAHNTEPYLVYRAAECVAIALSSVDEVLPVQSRTCAEGKADDDGMLSWRDELLPMRECGPIGVQPTPCDPGAVVIMRSLGQREARKVAAVEFIIPSGAAQMRAINWPLRGPEVMLTAAIDGKERSFRVSN